MDFNASLQAFWQLNTQFGSKLDLGLLVFARLLGFIVVAPVFNRRDIPFTLKLSFTLLLTLVMMWVIPHSVAPGEAMGEGIGMFSLQLVVNASIGLILGFSADMIYQTIMAAGSVMNNQIGLSSAMMFDPASRRQVMVLEGLFGMLAAVVFIQLGGFHWMISALERSFSVFPLTETNPHLPSKLDLDYLVTVSGNVLLVAVQLVSPVIVVTLAVDIILGIVNRAAQQMPVFQLSFALKPSIGVAVFMLTLPLFVKTLMHFLQDFKGIF